MEDNSTRSQLFGNRRGGAGGIGGGGGVGGHRAAFNESTERAMEAENDELHNLLGDKVAQLKHVSLRIKAETEKQNEQLEEMDDIFSKTLGSLGGTMKQLNDMMSSGGSKHMCYLSCFIFVFMLTVYLMVR